MFSCMSKKRDKSPTMASTIQRTQAQNQTQVPQQRGIQSRARKGTAYIARDPQLLNSVDAKNPSLEQAMRTSTGQQIESQVSSDADGLRLDTQYTMDSHGESILKKKAQDLKYLNFIRQENQNTRFQKDEVADLRRVFNRASARQKIKVQNEKGQMVEKSIEVMNKEQFRSQMGLLGQQQHPFLADRMFEVFDTRKVDRLEFSQFAKIMDVLCNGTEDEKNQFSFAMMDQNGSATISFQEFFDYFKQVISHWSSLINSNVRVNKNEIYAIFSKIDKDADHEISYAEYRRALRLNPELLDWFELLNSSKGGQNAQDQEDIDQQTEQLRVMQEEQKEKDKNIVKIERDEVAKIIRLNKVNEKKTHAVKKLKQQVNDMQGQTEEQLHSIMKQITMLSGQVQEQLSRKEEEKKQWEEQSVLLQQENLSQFDAGMSQFGVPTDPNIDQEREQQLYSQLIGGDDGDQDMPFAKTPGIEKFQGARDDEEGDFSRVRTRQPAMTFGVKGRSRAETGQNLPNIQVPPNQQQQDASHGQPSNSNDNKGSSANKQEYDSNATLQQWQQKGLLQKTNNGSNSPTGMSSNFHFSQFNYEFTTSRNPSMLIEESSNMARKPPQANDKDLQFDDRHLRTHDNLFDGSERVGHSGIYEPEVKKLQKVSSRLGGQEDIKNQSVSKTYEEILGPTASLNDILNFDFAGRYNSKQQDSREVGSTPKRNNNYNSQAFNTNSTAKSQTSGPAVSPIFEVLIKLRQGREQAKEKVGEKHIALEQVPSKQRLRQYTDPSNQVNQKIMEEDEDDIIMDPESPINSRSPSRLSEMSVNQNTASQNLKVNQRHQKRQEMRNKSNTNFSSFDNHSAVSSNLYRLSQMQGGGPPGLGNVGQQAQLQAEPQLILGAQLSQQRPQPHLTSSMAAAHQMPNPLSNSQKEPPYAHSAQKSQESSQYAMRNSQAASNPISPIPRQSLQTEDNLPPISQLVMNTSGSEAVAFRKNNAGIERFGASNTISRVGPHGIEETIQRTKSAFNGFDKGGDFENNSQFSQLQGYNVPKSNRTYIMPKAPESPKVEKEMLNKLGEVNQTVNTWLKQLEEKKANLLKAKTKRSLRSKSANTIPALEEDTDGQIDSEDTEQANDRHYMGDVVAELQRKMTHKSPMNAKAAQIKEDKVKKSNRGSKVHFEIARDAEYIVSSKVSNRSSSPAARDSNHLANTHAAPTSVKHMNKSKKDKTFIHFGNDNWNLVLHMLFGIRQSVHSVRYDDVFQLTDAEFKSKLRYELEASDEKAKILNWNLKKYEFYDFSPRMFNLIRKFYGINSNDYLKSIGPETLFGSLNMGKINSLKSQCSAGKSGSLFYYTADGLYMLKTISHDEFEHFKSIMKNYYHHMLAYPHTMIARFYGLHKIKFTRTTRIERVYFVIMGNVFNTSQSINVRYDLKGSTYGRTSRKNKDEVLSSTVALKDNDWLADKRLINLRDEQRNLLDQQLKADSKFFQDNNINDYSVLLGITKLKGGPREARRIVENSINFDVLYLEGINNHVEAEDKRIETKRTQSTIYPSGGLPDFENMGAMSSNTKGGNGRTQTVPPQRMLTRTDSDLLLHERQRPQKAFFESMDGGLVSADGTEIYFMGIIDILTNFGTKKRIENAVRSIVHNSKTISCIPPLQYGERFYQFMSNNVFLSEEQIQKEIEARAAGQPSPVFD